MMVHGKRMVIFLVVWMGVWVIIEMDINRFQPTRGMLTPPTQHLLSSPDHILIRPEHLDCFYLLLT